MRSGAPRRTLTCVFIGTQRSPWGRPAGPERSGVVDLAPPLGPKGVSVEIEGPDGLVGGAYGLPVAYDGPRGPGGRIRIEPAVGYAFPDERLAGQP